MAHLAAKSPTLGVIAGAVSGMQTLVALDSMLTIFQHFVLIDGAINGSQGC